MINRTFLFLLILIEMSKQMVYGLGTEIRLIRVYTDHTTLNKIYETQQFHDTNDTCDFCVIVFFLFLFLFLFFFFL